jgi:hypothetical protein
MQSRGSASERVGYPTAIPSKLLAELEFDRTTLAICEKEMFV